MLKPSLLWHYLRWKTDYRQCCWSGMFIPDPDFYPTRISEPGSWFLPIPDLGSRIQKQQQKRGVENKFVIILFFVVTNFTKLNLILFLNCWRNSHSLIKISISDPEMIRIQLSQWIRIRNPDPNPRGQKWPTKVEIFRKFMFWSAGCSFLRAESFFCSLEILYGGLGIGNLYGSFWFKKRGIFSSKCF